MNNVTTFVIGIIGGSGLYSFLENGEKRLVSTPFGDTTVEVGELEGKDVCFIPRHGSGHKTPPHAINYRANIFAAQLLKTERIFSTNAVGSSNLDVGGGSFVVLDQIFDMTNGRSTTFFDGQDFRVTTIKGATLFGVVHTDVSEPFDSNVRQTLINSCKYLDEKVVETGTIGVFNGPRYETPAEISAFTKLGINYFGMTSAPEAFLAKEIQIPYATLALVTNFASGLQSKVTHNEVTDLFEKRIEVIKKVIRHAIISS